MLSVNLDTASINVNRRLSEFGFLVLRLFAVTRMAGVERLALGFCRL